MTVDYNSKAYLDKVDAWWRAANYISAAQMYLKDNPLLKREVVENDLKAHPIGHWGTVPGQNFIYAHLNRAINKYDLDMFYIEGPGHGGQVMVSNSYLDGSYTELNPNIPQNEEGFKHLCKIFSFPGGIASHAAPETPGSIHEGGELGYALSHAAGAVLDNPDVIAATVIGDGEGETGPLMAGWLSNTFLNPVNDGGSFQSSTSMVGRSTTQRSSNAKQTKNWPSSLKVLVGNQSLRMSLQFQKTMKLHTLCSLKNWTKQLKKSRKSKQKLVKVLLKKQLNQFTLS